jgi:hypothetical protein
LKYINKINPMRGLSMISLILIGEDGKEIGNRDRGNRYREWYFEW